MLTQVDLARLVQDFYATVLSQENDVRLKCSGPIDEETRVARITHFASVAETCRRDLASNNFASADFVTAMMIQKAGLTTKIADPRDIRLVQQAMLRAGCDLAGALKARYEGDFNFEPSDKLLTEVITSALEDYPSSKPSTLESGLTSPSATSPSSPLFSTAAAEFRATQTRQKVWELQTSMQARKSYELFAELAGDRPLAGYLKEDAARFKAMLLELPAEYGKAVKYRGMTANAIVDATKTLDVPRLSTRTVKRHLTALSSLWDTAIESNQLPTNIFTGFKLPNAKRAQDQRAMWTTEDLDRLFSTPVWRGCKSAERRSKPGTLVIQDEKFWLPLIALFSGMRQEEICQLHLSDIKQFDGIWCFDINAAPPRQLKNANAIRVVPIHSSLLRIGLLAHVETQRDAGQDMLFHQLTRGGADMRLGHNFTKWFTRYRRDVGLYEAGKDFHSLRHSATTFLQRAKVQGPLIDALTGHSTPGETARYSKGYEIGDLKAAMDSLDPKIDLGKI